MKTFRQYLEESVKESHYVIKMAVKPTDEQVDAMETYLSKYDLIEMSNPVQLEKDKLDFTNIPNRQVWCIEFVTGMPVSQYMLLQQLRVVANVPEDAMIVRSTNEPVELEVQNAMFRDDDEEQGARLSTDSSYDDEEQPLVTDIYGDEYNKNLMDYLANVKATRKTDRYEAPAPLFSWMDMDKAMKKDAVESEDFNKDYDTVKPVTKGKDKAPIEKKYLGREGNLDDAAAKNVRFVRKNKEGRGEAISAPRATKKAKG